MSNLWKNEGLEADKVFSLPSCFVMSNHHKSPLLFPFSCLQHFRVQSSSPKWSVFKVNFVHNLNMPTCTCTLSYIAGKLSDIRLSPYCESAVIVNMKKEHLDSQKLQILNVHVHVTPKQHYNNNINNNNYIHTTYM